MYDLKICFDLLPALFSACKPRLALSPDILVLSLHKDLCWSTKVFMMDMFFFSWTALQARYKELHTTTKLHFAYDNFEQRVFEYLFF
jgi:hypothetical protein